MGSTRLSLLVVAIAACGGPSGDRALEIPNVERDPAPPATRAGSECVVETPGVAVITREIDRGISLTLVGGPARENRLRTLGQAIATTLEQREHPAVAPDIPEDMPPLSPEVPEDMPPLSPEVPEDMPPISPELPGEETTPRGDEIPRDQSPAINAEVENIAGGVEVIVTARPGDITRVRDEVRAYAERLQAGQCPADISG